LYNLWFDLTENLQGENANHYTTDGSLMVYNEYLQGLFIVIKVFTYIYIPIKTPFKVKN